MKEKQQVPGRLKEISREVEQQFSTLEQEPPNKPSFLMVVLIAAAAIILIFIVAWVVLRWGGGARFLSRQHSKVPTAQLIVPARPFVLPQTFPPQTLAS